MVEMVPTNMTQSATLSHMWLSSLKLNQDKVQSSIMPAIFQVFHSHPMARNTTPHGMGLASCGKSRQVFVNGCVDLKGLKTEASSTVVHFAVLPKASCFMVSGDSWAPSLPHIHGDQGAESWVSLLFIPPGHCKTFQCRGGAAQEAITIPPRLLPGSPLPEGLSAPPAQAHPYSGGEMELHNGIIHWYSQLTGGLYWLLALWS